MTARHEQFIKEKEKLINHMLKNEDASHDKDAYKSCRTYLTLAKLRNKNKGNAAPSQHIKRLVRQSENLDKHVLKSGHQITYNYGLNMNRLTHLFGRPLYIKYVKNKHQASNQQYIGEDGNIEEAPI